MQGRQELTLAEPLTGLHSMVRFQALPTNIRIGNKVIESDKHSSLLLYEINYGCKKSYGRGPGTKVIKLNLHLRVTV